MDLDAIQDIDVVACQNCEMNLENCACCGHCHDCRRQTGKCQPKKDKSEAVEGAVLAKPVRIFSTGATRDVDTNKLDVEAFNSPVVDLRYAQFMHENRYQKDGTLRDGDNWTKGMPRKELNKSLQRHNLDLRLILRGRADLAVCEDIEKTLCAIAFNAKALLLEVLLDRDVQ